MSRGLGAIEQRVQKEYRQLFNEVAALYEPSEMQELRARYAGRELPYVIYGDNPTESQKRSVRRALQSLRKKDLLPQRRESISSLRRQNPAAEYVWRVVLSHSRDAPAVEIDYEIAQDAKAGNEDARTTAEYYGGKEIKGTHKYGEYHTWSTGRLRHVIAGMQGYRNSPQWKLSEWRMMELRLQGSSVTR